MTGFIDNTTGLAFGTGLQFEQGFGGPAGSGFQIIISGVTPAGELVWGANILEWGGTILTWN